MKFHNFYGEKRNHDLVNCLFDMNYSRERFDLASYSSQELVKVFLTRSITKTFAYLDNMQIKIYMFKPPNESQIMLKKPYLW